MHIAPIRFCTCAKTLRGESADGRSCRLIYENQTTIGELPATMYQAEPERLTGRLEIIIRFQQSVNQQGLQPKREVYRVNESTR